MHLVRFAALMVLTPCVVHTQSMAPGPPQPPVPKFDPTLLELAINRDGIKTWFEAARLLQSLDHYGYSIGYGGLKSDFSRLYDWYSAFGTLAQVTALLRHPNPAVRMLGIELLTEQGLHPSPVPPAPLLNDGGSIRSWNGCMVGSLEVRQLAKERMTGARP